MDKKAIQAEKIVIREFRLVKGQIDSPFDFRMSNIKSFDFKVDFNTGFNLDEDLIKADFSIEVSTISLETVQEATCSYHFVFIFHVENIKEHTQLVEDGLIDWNPFMANAIASITYSTSRGILMSRFQGTIMKDFILPVVDPNALLQNKVGQIVNFDTLK
jgi:hypothetical protein